MSVIAVVGWKIIKDELIELTDSSNDLELYEKMDDISRDYTYYTVDEDYTNVVFGLGHIICDNWTLLPINIELIYEWYKNTKYEVMLHSGNYIPFTYRYCGQEPKLYFISNGE